MNCLTCELTRVKFKLPIMRLNMSPKEIVESLNKTYGKGQQLYYWLADNNSVEIWRKGKHVDMIITSYGIKK